MTDSATSTIAPTIQELNGAFLIPKPRKTPFRMSRARREHIEACVDGLLQLLDALDGDPDLETSTAAGTELGVPSGAWDDCEDNDDAEREEGEPSLGWTASNKQLGWPWYGDTDDREQEHDGREPDVDNEPDADHEADNDDEPSLASEHCADQTWWSRGNDDDREEEHDGAEPEDFYGGRQSGRGHVYVAEVLVCGNVAVFDRGRP